MSSLPDILLPVVPMLLALTLAIRRLRGISARADAVAGLPGHGRRCRQGWGTWRS